MLPLERVLFPVDFSERCRGAAHYVSALSARFDPKVTLLHVLPHPSYDFAGLEASGAVTGRLASERLAEARRRLDSFPNGQLSNADVVRVLVEGDPAIEIVEHAHARKSDLIVMPTHGYGPFRRFLLGSVTAKVLHDAECPLWTGVHMEQAPPLEKIKFYHILCAIDLGRQSSKVLHWAAQMAYDCNARLTVVHATPSLEEKAGQYFEHDWRIRFVALARQEIENLQMSLGTEAEVYIDSGDAAKVVAHAAERLGGDLLVIGRGYEAGRLRPHAYAIIRQSPCPVVSV